MIDSRAVAFKVLSEVLYKGAHSNKSIEKWTKNLDDQRDKNFVRELVYGVLENNIYIEHIIGKVSKVRLDRIHKDIFVVLKIGIYQIIFMDGVIDRAGVYETVELAKKVGNKGSVGYVNGVLRNISRNKDRVKEIEASDEIEYISIRYSHPRWMVELWIEEFGLEWTRGFCKYNNEVPEFTIRVNRLKIKPDQLIGRLENQGYEVEKSKWSKDSLIVKNPHNMIKLLEYEKGLFSIQGTSSTLVGEILNPRPNSKLIDTCSAPGGKSTHMAEIMGNQGVVYARDIYSHKLGNIKQEAKRLGIGIIKVSGFDGTKLDESMVNKVDYCLVDAPCSGFGTIAKNPEIKLFRKQSDVSELAKIQYEILSTSKEYVKPEGILLYSTCTIGRKENDDIVNRFLNENKNFELIEVDKKELVSPEGFVKLDPNKHGIDGFFMAKMVRKY